VRHTALTLLPLLTSAALALPPAPATSPANKLTASAHDQLTLTASNLPHPLRHLVTSDHAAVIIDGAHVGEPASTDHARVVFTDTDPRHLSLFAQHHSRVTLTHGAIIGPVHLRHQSSLHLAGGKADSFVEASDNATLHVTGGHIGALVIARDNASIHLSAGDAGLLAVVSNNAALHVYGQSLAAGGAPRSFPVTGRLADNSPASINAGFVTTTSSVVLHNQDAPVQIINITNLPARAPGPAKSPLDPFIAPNPITPLATTAPFLALAAAPAAATLLLASLAAARAIACRRRNLNRPSTRRAPASRLITATSLALFLLGAALWIRSYHRLDTITLHSRSHHPDRTHHRTLTFTTSAGGLRTTLQTFPTVHPPRSPASASQPKTPRLSSTRQSAPLADKPIYPYTPEDINSTHAPRLRRWGLRFFHDVAKSPHTPGPHRATTLILPWWLPCLLLSIPTLRALARANRHYTRLRANHCLTCGYDLQSSPTRCPECGTPTPG
jgi:hypothetical protein